MLRFCTHLWDRMARALFVRPSDQEAKRRQLSGRLDRLGGGSRADARDAGVWPLREGSPWRRRESGSIDQPFATFRPRALALQSVAHAGVNNFDVDAVNG